MVRGLFLAAAFALTACGGGAKKCNTNADCATGQTCDVASGTCKSSSIVGGGGGTTGGGSGGGMTGGGGGGSTGGGGGGGGMTGGGGGSTGGGGGSNDGGMGDGGMMMGGETCEMATPITAGTPVTGQDTASATDDYDGSGTRCEGSTAPDRAYSIEVPAGQKLTVVVTPDMAFDPTLSLADSAANCNVTCIAGRDNGSEGDPETLTYTNTGTAPATIFIVVDGYMDSAGAYELSATLETVMISTCATATPLTAGTPATMQSIATYASSYASTTGCAHSSGPDRAYSVTVPAGQMLLLNVTPDGASDLDLAISLVENAGQCGMACLASADRGFDSDPETLTFINPTMAAQQYLVVVDSWGGTGTFTIDYTTMMPPADDSCGGTLTTLVAGTPVTGQTTVHYVNDYETDGTETACNPPGQAGNGDTGGDRVYAFSVPAGQRATLTATPSMTFNPSLTVMENAAACTAMPRACLTAFDAAAEGEAETLRLRNTGMAAVNYLAIVDSSSGEGTFDLGLTLDMPAAEDVCASAAALTAGTVSGNLTGFVNDYGSASKNCLAFGSADRVYRVNVPAGSKVVNAVTPTVADGGLDVVINYVPGTANDCETLPRTCGGGADFLWDKTNMGLATGETGAYTNTTTAAQDVFVIVGNYAASASTDFSMTTTVAAAPAGETCANAVPVTATSMFAMETLLGASSDTTFDEASMTCLVANRLPDRVYAVTVPAGQTMTAVVTPLAGVNVAVNVFQGPSCTAVSTCLSNVNAAGAGMPETATYMNSGMAPATVFVQVFGVPPGGYGINFTIQ
ncbi:MAG: hypothetical protein ACOZQL_11940 [Myxococcota bacterium]